MIRDRAKLAGRLRRVSARHRQNKPIDRMIRSLRKDMADSMDRAERRAALRPKVEYPADLPITESRSELLAAIRDNQVIVVCGETGSGKSTQLPKLCIELGRGVKGLIGHTQPRRIAARTIADRVRSELPDAAAGLIGHKTRFADDTTPHTMVKVMTDGILLSETQQDRQLLQYDTLIIDEAHERTLNIDFLLGIIRQLLPRRPDLRIIITSATIDPQKFSDYFDGAPVIEVSGRMYPVEVRYRPMVERTEDAQADPGASDGTVDESVTERAIVQAAEELIADPTAPWGDILVFLPGERQIRNTARRLRGRNLNGTEVLPLYARLSSADQMRVFAEHSGRRIVLATNVAETSITVPGIRYVIDSGLARISRFSARSKVQRLPIEPISQASANQRAGRCGRVGPGVCIRLYSEADFADREAFTPPEILRSNLAGVMLQMKALGLGDIEAFPFVDPPRRSALSAAHRTLHELHAVDTYGQLTDIGTDLARLPVDPRLGRMLIAARNEHCLTEALAIVSALAVADPRRRPAESPEAADQAHQQFVDEQSDFLSYARLWSFFATQSRKLSRNRLRRACIQNYLSYPHMLEWRQVHHQLRDLVLEQGARLNRKPAVAESIHRALLTGLLSQVGQRTDRYEYTGPHNIKFHIHPGSGQFDKRPGWLMAGELVETTRLFARDVAPIQPNWLEELAEHLVSLSHANPRWDPTSARVIADERVSLFGLTIMPKRTAHFGPIDPPQARNLFIHHALVLGEYESPGRFQQHNRQLQQTVEQLEHKVRRKDLLADEQARFAFYDRRLPAHVHDGGSFEKWRKEAERKQPKLLYMKREDLLVDQAAHVSPEYYPDEKQLGQAVLPLDYLAEPGHEADGVTMTVPLELLGQVSDEQLTWLVPGMLREKVIMLIRSLPKAIRRHFVPVPDWADRVVGQLDQRHGPLLRALAATLGRLAGISIAPDAFDTSQLPEHLRMNIRIVDADDKAVAEGRDLAELRSRLADQLRRRFQALEHPDWNRQGIRQWTFGSLASTTTLEHGGLRITAYPMIVDAGDSVRLHIGESAERAQRVTRRGIGRLFLLQSEAEIDFHLDDLFDTNRLSLLFSPLGAPAGLLDQARLLIADRAFIGEGALPGDAEQFEVALDAGHNALRSVVQQVGRVIEQLLNAHARTAAAIENADARAWPDALVDMKQQMAQLVAGQFILDTPFAWLCQFPRYYQAIDRRMEKLQNGRAGNDAMHMAQVQSLWNQYAQRAAAHEQRGMVDPHLVAYRWMLEEYRVHLFAQDMGTAVPVSAKRLAEQWQHVSD